jgi:hypothetical protein
LGVASDSRGRTDRHLNSQALRIELSNAPPECPPSEGEICKHILMRTLARPPYASFIPRRLDGIFELHFEGFGRLQSVPVILPAVPQITILPRFSIQFLYDTTHGRCSPNVDKKWNHAAVGRERCNDSIPCVADLIRPRRAIQYGIHTPSILPSQSIDSATECMGLTCYVLRLSQKSSAQDKGTPWTVRCRADPHEFSHESATFIPVSLLPLSNR